MKILFLTHPYPNYVPDLLLHGLRKLMGPDVVEYPRKDCLYQGVLGLGVCPPNQLCPGWFPEESGEIDRQDVELKIARGFYACIVCDWRAWPTWSQRIAGCPSPVALIDGEDRPVPIRPGNHVVFRRETDGTDYSIPLPMALPEEVFHWIVSHDDVPKRYSVGFLGSTHDGIRKSFVEQLARWYPESLFSASLVPSGSNPNPAGRYGRDEYYRMLQQCRFVLTLSGSGHDTFRFWENAACNAVHIAPVLPLCIPRDFENGKSILRFSDVRDIRTLVDKVLGDPAASGELVANGRLNLIRFHFTTSRARYFLDSIRRELGAPPA